MSTALGIAGVSAVLESLLQGIFTNANLGSVTASALAPDIVQANQGAGAQLQVNLFLHQVTLNSAWRNAELPSVGGDGSTRLSSPPLALDLHYLMTAYATENCEAEALLGYGVQFIHENPVLARSQIRATLSALSATTTPIAGLLAGSGIADQIEMLKLTPESFNREELAWLWTALKADYRPTYPFQVTTVLIQSPAPLLSTLPVLQRTISVLPSLGPFQPTLVAVNPPNGQPAACLDDAVMVQGANLSGVTGVVLSNARLGVTQTLTPLANPQAQSFQFALPNPTLPAPQPNPSDFPAGACLVSAQATQGTETVLSNGLPLAVAPRIGPSWPPATIASGSAVTLMVPCSPYLRVGQQAYLQIGGQQAPADTFSTPTNTPTFTYPILSPTDRPVPVWLRVDGVDSPTINMTTTPPSFFGPLVQVT